jgi:hypothetical protein
MSHNDSDKQSPRIGSQTGFQQYFVATDQNPNISDVTADVQR